MAEPGLELKPSRFSSLWPTPPELDSECFKLGEVFSLAHDKVNKIFYNSDLDQAWDLHTEPWQCLDAGIWIHKKQLVFGGEAEGGFLFFPSSG